MSQEANFGEAITYPRRRATLASIAEATGVSLQTVSNVVRGKYHKVAPNTRYAVEAEIKRQGYVPNKAARGLRTSHSNLLGYRIRPATDGINGSVLDRLLHALSERAHDLGYGLIVFSSEDDQDEIAQYQRLISENNVDGFLLTSTNHGDQRATWLVEHHVPFVAFGRPWGEKHPEQSVAHDWIDVDGYCGTKAATELLLERGCQNIAFLGWPKGSGAGDDRRDGWADALKSAGKSADLQRETDDAVELGHQAAIELLADGADAIICASDSLAIGALVALRTARPELASNIIGFDNTPVAEAVGLTSVNQPIETAARKMVEQLVWRIENPDSLEERKALPLLPPTVVERQILQGFTPNNLPAA